MNEKFFLRTYYREKIKLYICHNKHFCVIWKSGKNQFVCSYVEEIEINFKYVDNKVS